MRPEHGGDIFRDVAGANMREQIRKAGPFMHVSQQIGNLDQRIHVADLGIQLLGGHRNFADNWCDDQRSGIKTNSFELAGSRSVRQTRQVKVEHLPGFGKPLRAISLDAQSETILLLHRDKCRPRHQMLINRPERSAAVDPDLRRSKPVSQSRERRDLVETAIRFTLFDDEPPISLAEVADRHALRERPTLLGIKPFQQRNCREKRIVGTRRAEREPAPSAKAGGPAQIRGDASTRW